MPETNLIDADSHVSEPLKLWQERLPAKYRDRAPRMVTEYRGEPGAWWINEGYPPHNVIRGFAVGKTEETFNDFLKNFSYAGVRAGGWDPAQRLTDMDQDGVAGDVLYTTLGFRMFWLRDTEFQQACFSVYNDWLAEFCSYDSRRLKGLAMISLYDPKQGAADLVRCAKQGLAGALIWASPPDELPFYSEVYDPFWAAAQDLNLPISLHEITGFERIRWEAEPQKRTLVQIVAPHETEISLSFLILSGVLERFPRLKFVTVEVNCGWIPYFLRKLEKMNPRTPFPTKLTLKPNEYFHRQVYTAFIDDPFAVQHRDEIGVDRMMWSSDYPHSVSFWPHSHDKIAQDFQGVSDADERRIVWRNAAQLYGFDAD